MRMTADILPQLSSVRLTKEVSALMTGLWQACTELTASVEDEKIKIVGVIVLADLPEALQMLQAECLPRKLPD